jgi:hypothetical protein
MTMFTLQETKGDGEAKGEPRRLSYHELPAAIALRVPRMKVKQLKHFIDLAVAHPTHPVDVTHWERGALIYSARLVCLYNTHAQKEAVHNGRLLDRDGRPM